MIDDVGGGTAGGRVRVDAAHELAARLRKLEAVADAARDVRNWLNGLRGVRKPPCDIELHLALCALDALDVKDSGGCGGDDAWWTG